MDIALSKRAHINRVNRGVTQLFLIFFTCELIVGGIVGWVLFAHTLEGVLLGAALLFILFIFSILLYQISKLLLAARTNKVARRGCVTLAIPFFSVLTVGAFIGDSASHGTPLGFLQGGLVALLILCCLTAPLTRFLHNFISRCIKGESI